MLTEYRPNIPAQATVITAVDRYAYHMQTLLVSYSMALLSAGVAVEPDAHRQELLVDGVGDAAHALGRRALLQASR